MKRFKHILYLLEPEIEQNLALERAVSLAENNQARLTVLQVNEPLRVGLLAESRSGARAEEALYHQQLQLAEMLGDYRQRVEINTRICTGTAAAIAIQEAQMNKQDLLIKPARKPIGLLDRILGGTDLQLMRKAPCPVWFVSGKRPQPYQHILVAVDFDPWQQISEQEIFNRNILELSGSLALAEFAGLHLAHCWEPISQGMMRLWGDDEDAEKISDWVNTEHLRHQEGLERLAIKLRTWIGNTAHDYLRPLSHLLKGSALETIPALVQRFEIDVLVMGSAGRSGISGLIIGNTAETLLNILPCDLLVIKAGHLVSTTMSSA